MEPTVLILVLLLVAILITLVITYIIVKYYIKNKKNRNKIVKTSDSKDDQVSIGHYDLPYTEEEEIRKDEQKHQDTKTRLQKDRSDGGQRLNTRASASLHHSYMNIPKMNVTRKKRNIGGNDSNRGANVIPVYENISANNGKKNKNIDRMASKLRTRIAVPLAENDTVIEYVV